MLYHTAVILLAKPFFPQNPARSSSGHRLTRLCLDAVKEILLLGQRYCDAFGSFRRNPVTATHCTLTAALMALQLNIARENLDPLLATLKGLSTAWVPADRNWRSLARIVGERQQQEQLNPSPDQEAATADRDDTVLPLGPETPSPSFETTEALLQREFDILFGGVDGLFGLESGSGAFSLSQHPLLTVPFAGAILEDLDFESDTYEGFPVNKSFKLSWENGGGGGDDTEAL
ncbi:hypothetical protein BDW74DRAFT_100547 [Aspergillus multicolor]|uniref:fungal specific transcription factor domain-containing protein n=1 Tax=Aspergillus multicolor TaxID=41759 RepID=UPI003CCD11CC